HAARSAEARRRLLSRRRRFRFLSANLLRRLFDGVQVLEKRVLGERRRRQLFEQRLVLRADLLDGQQPIGQLVLAGVRLGEAQVHQLLGRAHEEKVCTREFEIAGYEVELLRLRVKIQMIVVPEPKEALGIGGESVGGQEAQKRIHVEESVDLLGE